MTERTCSIDGCEKKLQAKGFCSMHYMRVRTHGVPGPAESLHPGGFCEVNGCGRPLMARGFCKLHYQRNRIHGDPLRGRRPRGLCEVDECGRPHTARGLCSMHYWRFTLHGDVLLSPKQPRLCEVDGCGRPHLARGLCTMHYSRVRGTGETGPSGTLYPGLPWLNNNGYLCQSVDGRQVLVHRYVMEKSLGRLLTPQENVHHLNGIRTDNRPENLELWTKSQPCGQRVTDKVAWCIEFLTEYAPELLADHPVQLRVVN